MKLLFFLYETIVCFTGIAAAGGKFPDALPSQFPPSIIVVSLFVLAMFCLYFLDLLTSRRTVPEAENKTETEAKSEAKKEVKPEAKWKKLCSEHMWLSFFLIAQIKTTQNSNSRNFNRQDAIMCVCALVCTCLAGVYMLISLGTRTRTKHVHTHL